MSKLFQNNFISHVTTVVASPRVIKHHLYTSARCHRRAFSLITESSQLEDESYVTKASRGVQWLQQQQQQA